jgi:signal transduction histidine kinase
MRTLDRLTRWRGTVVNAGLGVGLALVLAIEAGNLAGSGRPWLLDCAVGLVLGATALLRGRGRGTAAVAGLVVAAAAEAAAYLWSLPGQPGPAAALALLVLIGSAVRVLPARAAAVIAAGGAAVLIGSMAGHPDLGHLPAVGWGAALGTGLWLRLLDAHRRAGIETAVEAVRRGERLELARELHDSAAHHITGIVIQAQAARIAARSGAAPDDALASIESAGAEALAALRHVIGLLRDADDAGGLTPGPEQLTDLLGRFAGYGPAVRLRLPDGPADPAWPPEVATTVYRVVAEALTNITRHAAGAREVTVTVAHDQRAITVEVTDDAPGPSPAPVPPAGGYGLVGMRERVENIGGTLRAGPRPAAGWSVHATLPAPARS